LVALSFNGWQQRRFTTLTRRATGGDSNRRTTARWLMLARWALTPQTTLVLCFGSGVAFICARQRRTVNFTAINELERQR